MRITKLVILLFINLGLMTPHCFAKENNETSLESVIIFWTDGSKLKAVNLTVFPNQAGPIGIVSVPINTCLSTEQQRITTVRGYYTKYGREKLIQQLENLFGTPIGAYISVDQEILANVSGIIGHINMAGQQTTLMEVFKGNYIDGPVNLQVEIRQLADAMISPVMIFKIPKIMWVFSKQTESNIGPRNVMDFYRVLRYRGPNVLQKKAVPGHDYIIDNRKYRRVDPDTWPKTLKEVTS